MKKRFMLVCLMVLVILSAMSVLDVSAKGKKNRRRPERVKIQQVVATLTMEAAEQSVPEGVSDGVTQARCPWFRVCLEPVMPRATVTAAPTGIPVSATPFPTPANSRPRIFSP